MESAVEMDEDFKNRIIDRFEGFELVELLDISIEDVVEAFEEILLKNEEYLEEFIEIGR